MRALDQLCTGERPTTLKLAVLLRAAELTRGCGDVGSALRLGLEALQGAERLRDEWFTLTALAFLTLGPACPDRIRRMAAAARRTTLMARFAEPASPKRPHVLGVLYHELLTQFARTAAALSLRRPVASARHAARALAGWTPATRTRPNSSSRESTAHDRKVDQ